MNVQVNDESVPHSFYSRFTKKQVEEMGERFGFDVRSNTIFTLSVRDASTLSFTENAIRKVRADTNRLVKHNGLTVSDERPRYVTYKIL